MKKRWSKWPIWRANYLWLNHSLVNSFSIWRQTKLGRSWCMSWSTDEWESFFHLFRVLSPQLITACVDHNITIPYTSYPLYSLAMQGLTICCTNLPHTDRVNQTKCWTTFTIICLGKHPTSSGLYGWTISNQFECQRHASRVWCLCFIREILCKLMDHCFNLYRWVSVNSFR